MSTQTPVIAEKTFHTLHTLLVAILLTAMTLTAYAENYPYRSDFLWVTTPNHANWLYTVGEKATIEVQLYKYGVAVDGVELSYEVAPDMLEPSSKGKVTVRNGKAVISMGTRSTPGFQDLRLSAVVDGMTTKHHVKVGFSVDKIEPFTKEPKDFKAFWDETLKQYQNPVEISRELASEYCTDKIDCWLVKLRTDREHYIYGYLTMPKDARSRKLPAVMCPPGAGVKTIKEPLRHRYYAENGFIRFEVEIHGMNPTWSEKDFKDIQQAFASRDNNYLTNGISSRERYYMRHVYGGMVAALRYLQSLSEYDGRNLAVQGGSQGGALSLITAALCPDVQLCVVNHPALTDMAAYIDKGRTGGYPNWKGGDILTQQNIETLAYYDVINFCRYVKCPVRMTWGYNDSTCSPTTSYAAWNTLKCEKEAFITPINEHWTSETMERQHMEWIKSRLSETKERKD